MDLNDSRIDDVLKAIDSSSVTDLSQSDYDRIEDNYIAFASELVLADDELAKLRNAGFTELVERIEAFTSASRAYDWSRENL